MLGSIAEQLLSLASRILTWSAWAFLAFLALILLQRARLDPQFFGTLLRVKRPQSAAQDMPLSPARVQLLLASLGTAFALLLAPLHGRPLELPQELTYALLGSNASYLLLKGRQIHSAQV